MRVRKFVSNADAEEIVVKITRKCELLLSETLIRILTNKAHTTSNYTDFIKLVNELEKEMLNKYLGLL